MTDNSCKVGNSETNLMYVFLLVHSPKCPLSATCTDELAAGLCGVWLHIIIFWEADNHAALSKRSPKLEYIVCGATSALTRSENDILTILRSEHSAPGGAVQMFLQLTSKL